MPFGPPLGYRGCFLQGSRTQWYAYGGVVAMKVRGRSEMRKDEERAFEKSLLASAPRGAIPESVAELGSNVT